MKHKTKREKIIIILKKINMKNINKGIEKFGKGMDTFSKIMQDFGSSMDQLTKELNSTNKHKSNDKENLEKIWGKPSNKSSKLDVKIWSDSPKRKSKSQKSKDEINLEKIWEKRK